MTMRLKFADGTADEGFTDIFAKTLNLKAMRNVLGIDNVLDNRTRQEQEPREAMLRAEGLLGSKRLVERDALSEMLEEMSLSSLLYYVLAGDGRNTHEPA